MLLRNGKNIGCYSTGLVEGHTVIINFDQASNAWRNNKIYLGNGFFRYKAEINLFNPPGNHPDFRQTD